MGPQLPRFLVDYEVFVEDTTIYPDRVVEKIRRSKGTASDLIDLYNYCLYGDEEEDQRITMKRHLESELREVYGYFVPTDSSLVADSKCHILDELPTEMRLAVMKHLGLRDLLRLAMTCKVIYRELAQVDFVVKCDLRCRKIGNTGLKAVLRNFKKLRVLNLSYCCNFTDAAFYFYRRRLENLRKLNLTGTSINDAQLSRILDRCPKLTSLNIQECKNINGKFLARRINSLFLEELSVTGSLISERDFIILARGHRMTTFSA